MEREHPLVALILATGQTRRGLPGRRSCCDCGSWLMGGDGFYVVAGESFCESCMADRREEVQL